MYCEAPRRFEASAFPRPHHLLLAWQPPRNYAPDPRSVQIRVKALGCRDRNRFHEREFLDWVKATTRFDGVDELRSAQPILALASPLPVARTSVATLSALYRYI